MTTADLLHTVNGMAALVLLAAAAVFVCCCAVLCVALWRVLRAELARE
jgi:hypothetical protein